MQNLKIKKYVTKSEKGNDLEYEFDEDTKKFRMISNSKGGTFDKNWHDIDTFEQTIGSNNNNIEFDRRIVEDIKARKLA